MALKRRGGEGDLRALGGGCAHGGGNRVDIVVDAVGEGKLEGGDGYVRHILLRHPSEGWHPSGGAVPTSVWIPAFAGMTARRNHTGTCWLMQWKLPPPVRMWSALKPTASRPGNRAPIASTAASSFGAPSGGTTSRKRIVWGKGEAVRVTRCGCWNMQT